MRMLNFCGEGMQRKGTALTWCCSELQMDEQIHVNYMYYKSWLGYSCDFFDRMILINVEKCLIEVLSESQLDSKW